MRNLILLVCLIMLFSCDSLNSLESAGENYFVKFYGEDGDHTGVDMVTNSDGSFILVGNERVVGDAMGQQIYLVKVDALGTVVWQERFGTPGDDFAKDIELTVDGNVIIAAEVQKISNDRDVFVIIVSQSGSLVDSFQMGLKKLDGQEGDEVVNSISIIQGGYIVSGSTTAVETNNPNDITDALHIRLNNSLDPIDPATGLWKNTSHQNDSDDVLVKMFESSPSAFYGFGYTNTVRNSKRDYKYWTFSLGATGEPTNNGTDLLDIIGSQEEDEKLSGMTVSPPQSGEGFVLSGVRTNTARESQAFIVKLQRNLFVPGEDNVLAEESPIVLGNLEDVVDVPENTLIRSSMVSLSQGGFLLLTNSKSPSTDEVNISLIKLSNTFLKVWDVPLLFGGVGNDFAGTVSELPDGKIVIVGTMTLGGVTGQTKMVLMKLNSEGKFIK